MTKIRISITIVITLLLGIWFFFPLSNTEKKSAKESAVDNALLAAAKKIEQTQDLAPVGIGARMLHEVKKLFLAFTGYHELEIDESRVLLVHSVQIFLNTINNSSDLKQYLITYPFTSEHIGMHIELINEDQSELANSQISFIKIHDNTIRYYWGGENYDIDNPALVETYEEAVAKVKALDEGKALN